MKTRLRFTLILVMPRVLVRTFKFDIHEHQDGDVGRISSVFKGIVSSFSISRSVIPLGCYREWKDPRSRK